MPSSPNSSVFFGSDEGAAAAAANAAYKALSEGGDGWGDEIIDGNAATVDEALGILQRCIMGLETLNMFGGRKVIWLKGANFFSDNPSGMRSESVQQAAADLLAVLGKLPEETFFLLSAAEMDKRRTFFKELSKIAQVKEFAKIDISGRDWESQLAALSVRMAKELGLSFDNAALDLFIHRVNESSRQIANELAKLDVYLGAERRKLSEADIELMVPVSRNGIIFEISRAIEQGNCGQAIRLVDEQLENGEQGVSIMRAAIVPGLRSRFCARVLMEEYHLNCSNYRDFEAAVQRLPEQTRKILPAKKDGTVNSYAVFNAARSCGKLKLSRARQDLQNCAKADRALVSSGLDARDILHKLIVSLCA